MVWLHRVGLQPTGRYTFRIDTEPCAVYRREVDTHLSIEPLPPPRIVAVKPFAVSSGYVVEFNLETGWFEEFIPNLVMIDSPPCHCRVCPGNP